jgi:Ca2+/H+ antiporter
VLYGSFVFIQTVRHRDYFLPMQNDDQEAHAPPAAGRTAVLSAGLLLVSLVAIVGLAKILTPTVERGVARLDVPKAVVGIIIATLVLMPEGLAALRAAWGNRLQISLNLALGSALATIGLTIPAVAAVSIVLRQPLELSLDRKDQALLALTLLPQRDHLGHRPDLGASGHRTFGHLRRISVLCGGAVKRGGPSGLATFRCSINRRIRPFPFRCCTSLRRS